MRLFLKIYILIIVMGSLQVSIVAEAKKSRAPKKSKEVIKEERRIKRSQRAMWIAHVLREKNKSKRIKELDIELLKVPVFLVPRAESFRPLVKLKFKFKKEGWGLVDAEGSPLRKVKDKNDEYLIYAYLNSRVSTVELTALGPDKAELKETVYLFAPEAREFKTTSVFSSIQYFAGHTYLVYRQASSGRFVSQSLLLGVKYLSPEKGRKRGYLADLSSTVYTYSASPVQRTFNFLEGRVAATHKIKLFKDPKYRTRLSAGLGTINLFSLGSAVGFSGLYGPNFGVRTEYYESGVNSYSFEFQFMPYEFKDPLSERTLKLAFEWTKNLDNLRLAQLGLSYSNHSFVSGVDQVDADLLSIYFSLSF